jgi:transaldolase
MSALNPGDSAGASPQAGPYRGDHMDQSRLQRLSEYGQSPWVEGLSRSLLASGELARLVRDHGIKGVISNASALARVLREGIDYDEQISTLLTAGEDSTESIALLLAVRDAQGACDLMRATFESSGHSDGYVSFPADPRFAHDAAGARARATLVWGLVDRPNLLVRIPATPTGLRTIEELIAARVSVDATLIFSLPRYRDVVEAYARGIERLTDLGGDPSPVCSVASVLVSRIDAEADGRLDAVGGEAIRLKGQLAIATARLVYQYYTEAFGGERWRRLAAKGARRQRCRWASTSTERAAYGDLFYLEELIGPDTVTTIEPETVASFEARGVVADRLERRLADAGRIARNVMAAGVDLDDVWRTLEAEAVRSLRDGFDAVLEAVATRCSGLGHPMRRGSQGGDGGCGRDPGATSSAIDRRDVRRASGCRSRS